MGHRPTRRDQALATLRTLLAFVNARRKAVAAFVLPGLGVLAPTLLDGDLPTTGQWRSAAAICLLTAFGVERVRNRLQRRAEG